MWRVAFHPAAELELNELPPREKAAMLNAIEKLQALGPTLPFPHQSDVRTAESLRELRPRSGKSAWRGVYRRVADTFVIAAIAPDAEADRRGFDRSVKAAEDRLRTMQPDREKK